MIWEDVLFDRVLDDEALARAVAEVFAVGLDSVRLVDEVTPQIADGDQHVRILIERFCTLGDFPLQTSIYLLDERLAERAEPREKALRLIARICALLECTCLVGDDSPSVLTWWRVHGSGLIEAVRIDSEALEREEYTLDSSVPVRTLPGV